LSVKKIILFVFIDIFDVHHIINILLENLFLIKI